jgi:hypothetical protein
MADSQALRSRRCRKHRAGDHSECRHDDGSGPPAVPLVVRDGIEPRAALVALACRLEAAHVADPANERLARELRATLLVLLPPAEAGEAPDFVAELAALAVATT